MNHRGELSRSLCAERDFLNRVWTIAVASEHLCACIDDLDWALEFPSCHRCQRRIIVRAQRRSESAANEGRDHAHVFLGHAEARSQMYAHAIDPLRLVEDRELVALPDRDGRVRLYGVVVFDRDAVLGFYLDSCCTHRLFGITARLWRRPL